VDVARAEKKDRSMPPGVWHGPQWGTGYAEDAARAAIEDGFFRLGFAEIVAFAVPENGRSWHLMERLAIGSSVRCQYPFTTTVLNSSFSAMAMPALTASASRSRHGYRR
jgi:hypothetical protein